jgi:hypothetical protein
MRIVIKILNEIKEDKRAKLGRKKQKRTIIIMRSGGGEMGGHYECVPSCLLALVSHAKKKTPSDLLKK